MLNITNYLRNANQNYSGISHHISQMAIIKISTDNKHWRRLGEKGSLLHYWWESKLIQSVWSSFKKLKTKLLYHPAILLLGIYPDKIKIQKDACTPMFIAGLFTIARIWIQP